MTDGHLLERFVLCQDQAAFAELVRRHGPTVLGVCRRATRYEQDAEDAFQATFLVLARRATSIVPPDLVANWLFGVACRTARKMNAHAAKRHAREKQVSIMPEPLVNPEENETELAYLLDREIALLPEKYRIPVILCELQGRPRKDVARQLGLAQGTLSSRLANARRLLAKRLTRRGIAPTVSAIAGALAANAAPTAVPAALVDCAVNAATLTVSGGSLAPSVSAHVLTVAESVVKFLLVKQMSGILAVLILCACVVLAGVGWSLRSDKSAQAPNQDHGSARVQSPPSDKELQPPVTLVLRKSGEEPRMVTLVHTGRPGAGGAVVTQLSIRHAAAPSQNLVVGELVLDGESMYSTRVRP